MSVNELIFAPQVEAVADAGHIQSMRGLDRFRVRFTLKLGGGVDVLAVIDELDAIDGHAAYPAPWEAWEPTHRRAKCLKSAPAAR